MSPGRESWAVCCHRNPGVPTIEEDLLAAMCKALAFPASMENDLAKVCMTSMYWYCLSKLPSTRTRFGWKVWLTTCHTALTRTMWFVDFLQKLGWQQCLLLMPSLQFSIQNFHAWLVHVLQELHKPNWIKSSSNLLLVSSMWYHWLLRCQKCHTWQQKHQLMHRVHNVMCKQCYVQLWPFTHCCFQLKFQRCARTDKGVSALRQLVSIKMSLT